MAKTKAQLLNENKQLRDELAKMLDSNIRVMEDRLKFRDRCDELERALRKNRNELIAANRKLLNKYEDKRKKIECPEVPDVLH